MAWAVDAILLFAIAAALMVVAGATGSTSHASGGLLLAALLLVPLVYVVDAATFVWSSILVLGIRGSMAVSYTHLTLPTNREV